MLYNLVKTNLIKVLSSLQIFLKFDLKFIIKNGFWLSVGQFISSISSLLLAITFANLLTKETYGTFRYVISLIGILSIPTLNGINTAVTQSVSRGFEGNVFNAFKKKIQWGLIGGVGALFISIYYFFQNNTTLSISFLIISIFIPIMDPLVIYGSYLNGKNKFKELSSYNIYTTIISSVIIIVLIYFTQNIFLLIFCYLATNTLLRLLYFIITFKKYKPNNFNDPEIIKYGKQISLIETINTIYFYIDKTLLFIFFGPVQLAIYSMAIAPTEQIKNLLKNINLISLPKFSQDNKNIQLRKKIYKIMIVLIFITIAYILFIPYFYYLFFPQYINAILYSQIFSISLIFIAPIYILYSYIKGQKKIREIYAFNVYGSIIKIIITVILIYYFQIMGAIISRVLGFLFEFLFLIRNKK